MTFAICVRFDLKPGAEEGFDELVHETLSLIQYEEPETLSKLLRTRGAERW